MKGGEVTLGETIVVFLEIQCLRGWNWLVLKTQCKKRESRKK